MTVAIYRLPAFQTNYLFLLHDVQHQTAAIVDPGEFSPVKRLLDRLGARLTAIFNTHHHVDHIGANAALLQQYPGAIVYGGFHDRGRIPGQQFFLNDGDEVWFGNYRARVLFIPGHTRAHIAYYFPAQSPNLGSPNLGVAGEGFLPEPCPGDLTAEYTLGSQGDLFCGDTLFGAGCGRLFEGTPAEMLGSLDKLRSLPDDTRIWCAHEYTLGNLEFALTIEPENAALHDRYIQVKDQRDRQEATIPSLLAMEKETNPFLRWDQRSVQQSMGSEDPVKTFRRLRGKKDLF